MIFTRDQVKKHNSNIQLKKISNTGYEITRIRPGKGRKKGLIHRLKRLIAPLIYQRNRRGGKK